MQTKNIIVRRNPAEMKDKITSIRRKIIYGRSLVGKKKGKDVVEFLKSYRKKFNGNVVGNEKMYVKNSYNQVLG